MQKMVYKSFPFPASPKKPSALQRACLCSQDPKSPDVLGIPEESEGGDLWGNYTIGTFFFFFLD